jgi:phage baseplate assembly protein W
MSTFIGFNTIDQPKKFTLTDFELVKRDLLNGFNIQQGQLVGRPQYGSAIWNFLFENQTQEIQSAILQEVQRVAGQDPRLYIDNIQLFPQDNGIMIQISASIVPGTTAEQLNIFFNQETRRASYV